MRLIFRLSILSIFTVCVVKGLDLHRVVPQKDSVKRDLSTKESAVKDADIGQIGENFGNIEEVNFHDQKSAIKPDSQVVRLHDIGQIGINNGIIKEWNYRSLGSQDDVDPRTIGQIGINTGQLTSNTLGSIDPSQEETHEPSVGQIGIDLGKRTENRFVLPASSLAELLGYADTMDDIDQLQTNNGQVYEFNFGQGPKITVNPVGVAVPVETGIVNGPPREVGGPSNGGGDDRHRRRFEEERRRRRIEEENRRRRKHGDKDREQHHRDEADLKKSMQDIGQIGINNGKIVENNGVDLGGGFAGEGFEGHHRHHHRRYRFDDEDIAHLLAEQDSMADIGQIGINNGKIVENNGVDLGVFRPFRHHHRRLYDDDQVVLLIQGPQDDIGQIGINNGLIQEYNYGRRFRKFY